MAHGEFHCPQKPRCRKRANGWHGHCVIGRDSRLEAQDPPILRDGGAPRSRAALMEGIYRNVATLLDRREGHGQLVRAYVRRRCLGARSRPAQQDVATPLRAW